jgi:hypothetical protein
MDFHDMSIVDMSSGLLVKNMLMFFYTTIKQANLIYSKATPQGVHRPTSTIRLF